MLFFFSSLCILSVVLSFGSDFVSSQWSTGGLKLKGVGEIQVLNTSTVILITSELHCKQLTWNSKKYPNLQNTEVINCRTPNL